jgi:hypothetical protein
MTYRITYVHHWAPVTGVIQNEAERTEHFRIEYQALDRARELVESGLHHRVVVYDSTGNALTGVRIQLKLGASVTD